MSNVSYTFSNRGSSLPLKLLYVSKSKYDRDWHSTMHMHPFTELFYVVSGEGLFLIEDKSFTVKQDDLVIVNANILHTESSKDSNPMEYIVLGIDGMSLKALEKNERLVSEKLYSIQNYRGFRSDILYYFNTILEEAEQQKEHYESICHNLLEIMIFNFLRTNSTKVRLTTDPAGAKELDYVKHYIDVNYASDLDLDSLAAATYMNKYYLSHMFKKNYGVSPINYLIEKRISVSKFLLETTNYSIGQIAQIVGFNSSSYFSQIFKKRTGITPSEYREAVLTDKAN